MKSKHLLSIFVLVLLCTLFTSCGQRQREHVNSQNFNPNPAGLTDFSGIEKEYLETIQNLNWPEGFELPDRLENVEKDIQFQKGYGDTLASNLWQYAWEKEWLDTYQSDPDRADKAIQELEKAFDMGYLSPQRADDATRKFLRDYIDRAKLGDPSGFQQDIQANGSN